jgi:WD40 repeat protein
MLAFLDVHFKALTSITFSNNQIVTTSLDSLVHVLDFNTVLNGESTPSHTLDKHALGVTDASVGLKKVYSVGKDCMLWTWEVETGQKSGYVYPRMLSKICLDVLERVIHIS